MPSLFPPDHPVKSAVSLKTHPATLPEADIPGDIDHAAIASASVSNLAHLSVGDLAENTIWRDSLAFTGTLRTFFRPALVSKVWQKLSCKHSPHSFAINPGSSRIVRLGPRTCWVEAGFTFDTAGERPARCSGIIGLVPTGSDELSYHGEKQPAWKIWLLCTILEQPEGFPDVDKLVPGRPTFDRTDSRDTRGADSSTVNGRHADADSNPAYVDCLVVGAGVGGLCMAGRLKSLGLSYLVVEKDIEVGDTWLKHRHESLKLHTPKAYAQMPGEPKTWGSDAPYFLSGRDVAKGFQRYVEIFGINVLTSTKLISAKWFDEGDCWELCLHSHGAPLTVRARHVVLAVGNMGVKPKTPTYAHRDVFKGDVVHALHWRTASPWKGKRGVVVGSANSAHDIIADMAHANLDVTMIQRSRTFVLPVVNTNAVIDRAYNDQIPVDKSDRMMWAYPLPIQRHMAMRGVRMMADSDPVYFGRLEAQGFKVEPYGDLWGTLYDREGGHFLDTGAGELIADGKVKVRSDALPVAYTETGLAMSDGSCMDADIIVFATGYTDNVKAAARQIFGDEVASGLQEFWQCDDEGEIRGAYRDTGHPRIWYTGYGFAHSRYMARFVALRIKADAAGMPMDVYTDTPQI